MTRDLPEITTIEKLDVGEGDTVVVTTIGKITACTAEHIRETLRTMIGDAPRILILDNGTTLQVIRKAGDA